MVKINLSELIEHMEIQPDEIETFYDPVEGKFYLIDDQLRDYAEHDDKEDTILHDWQKEIVAEIRKAFEIEDRLINTPTKFDIHDYKIMEQFCDEIENENLRNTFFRAIKRRGAFRNFRDKIHNHDLESQWYNFRDTAYRSIALDWCKTHNIPFTEEAEEMKKKDRGQV